MEINEADIICQELISSDTTKDRIKEVLVELKSKGETASEVAGFYRALINKAQVIPYKGPTIDLCGTGGAELDRFNVSTSVAFIMACFDVKLAKHGNKGSRKPNGSFDLLEYLGIPIELNREQLAECLEKTNLAFIFARKAHPAMKNVAEARKEINGRTIFNLAGPLSNPTQVRRQVIGTAERKTQGVLLDAGRLLGRESVAVVYGEPGVDEVSISGKSMIISFNKDKTSEVEWSPEEIGLPLVRYENLPVGLVENNAAIFTRLLDNESLGGINDMVCVNAALSLVSCGIVNSMREGYDEAKKIVKSGDMKRKFLHYKKFSTSMIWDGFL